MCEFCDRLGQSATTREWYDFHVMAAEPAGVIVPALGSLVPGYLLAVPRIHTLSVAALPDTAFHGFMALVLRATAFLSRFWGSAITVFEHGECSGRIKEKGGACILHAHWHLVPGSFELGTPRWGFRRFSSFEAFREGYTGSAPYLMSFVSRGSVMVREGRAPSQFFRRRIASRIGRTAEWDYLGAPNLEHMRETLQYWDQYCTPRSVALEIGSNGQKRTLRSMDCSATAVPSLDREE